MLEKIEKLKGLSAIPEGKRDLEYTKNQIEKLEKEKKYARNCGEF
jgi:hypothetical protein